jgi:hypothetical protein
LAIFALALVTGAASALFRRRRSVETEGQASFWTIAPAVVRLPLLAATPFAVLLLCDQVVPLWSSWGWQLPALVFGVLLLPALRRRSGGAIPWTGWYSLLVVLLALGIITVAASHFGGLAAVLGDYWRETSAGSQYVYLTLDRERLQVMGASWIAGPAPLVWGLLAAAVIAALLRRASITGAVGALHTGARTLAGGLVAGYILYLLLAVPANDRAVRLFEELMRRYA